MWLEPASLPMSVPNLRTSSPSAKHNKGLAFPFQSAEHKLSHGGGMHAPPQSAPVQPAPHRDGSHWQTTSQVSYIAPRPEDAAGRAAIPDFLKKVYNKPEQQRPDHYKSRYDNDFNPPAVRDYSKCTPSTMDLYAGTYLASPYIGNTACHIPRALANTLPLAERAEKRPRNLKDTLEMQWKQNLLGTIVELPPLLWVGETCKRSVDHS